jgi:hypothetical protein
MQSSLTYSGATYSSVTRTDVKNDLSDQSMGPELNTRLRGTTSPLLTGRRLMTTERGYFGWVARPNEPDPELTVRQGDPIAILPGCRVPTIFRQVGRHSRVLSQAYTQGLMDGQASNMIESV